MNKVKEKAMGNKHKKGEDTVYRGYIFYCGFDWKSASTDSNVM